MSAENVKAPEAEPKQEAEIVAAGVLPCARTPGGKLMFLLGQEGCAHGLWKDAGAWDAFGGRRDLYEDATPRHTAAREFYEETGGVVCSREYMLEQLLSGNYLTCYDTRSKNCAHKFYRTYVIMVPFRDYPDRFADVYAYLRSRRLEGVLEKRQMRWFSADQVRESLSHHHHPIPSSLASASTDEEEGPQIVTPTHLFTKRILLRWHFARGLAHFFATAAVPLNR
jgi:predicted NUDIX family NTP pyrophosphohydrolase